MCLENSGGFKASPIKCPHCGKVFRVEDLSSQNNGEAVEYCPFCGRNIDSKNELSDDELLDQIKEAEHGK